MGNKVELKSHSGVGTNPYTKDELEKASSELLPCPYCGQSTHIVYLLNGIITIKCDTPRCHGNTPYYQDFKLSNVIKAFNTRVLPDKEE